MRQFMRRLIASEAELDAEELQRDAVSPAVPRPVTCRRGQLVSVTGRLRTVVYTPRTNLPTLEADLYDGSDVVTLVWLGAGTSPASSRGGDDSPGPDRAAGRPQGHLQPVLRAGSTAIADVTRLRGPDRPGRPMTATSRAGIGELADRRSWPRSRCRRFSEQMAEQLGGVRGLVESSIPVVVFVIVNIIWRAAPGGDRLGRWSALAIAGYRLTRREPVRHALNGLFGIGIGAIIAWKTGRRRTSTCPASSISLGLRGGACWSRWPFRRPLVGWIWSVLVAAAAPRGATSRGWCARSAG